MGVEFPLQREFHEPRKILEEDLKLAFFMILIQIGGDAKSLNGMMNLRWLIGNLISDSSSSPSPL